MTGAALTPTGVLVGATSGNARVSIDAGQATDALALPAGTSGQRPTGILGEVRFNKTLNNWEGFITSWVPFGGGEIQVQNNSVAVNTTAIINFVNSSSVLVIANDDFTHSRVNLEFIAVGGTGATVNVGANATYDLQVANINFNNTSTINVAVASVTGNTANVSFVGNVAAITALTEANVTLAFNQANAAYNQANVATDDAEAAYAQANAAYAEANAAANTVATYANGTLVLADANLNFNNSASIGVSVTANGTHQTNIALSFIGTGSPANVQDGIVASGNVQTNATVIAANTVALIEVIAAPLYAHTANLVLTAANDVIGGGTTDQGYYVSIFGSMSPNTFNGITVQGFYETEVSNLPVNLSMVVTTNVVSTIKAAFDFLQFTDVNGTIQTYYSNVGVSYYPDFGLGGGASVGNTLVQWVPPFQNSYTSFQASNGHFFTGNIEFFWDVATPGIILPALTAGQIYVVFNEDSNANSFFVYPSGNNQIDDQGNSQPYLMVGGEDVSFYAANANSYYTIAPELATGPTFAVQINSGTGNTFYGDGGFIYDVSNGNVSVAGAVNTGTLFVGGTAEIFQLNVDTSLNVSANISNTGNLLVTQNTFTGNLSVTQNISGGNISVANANVSGIANLLGLISPNTTTYANGTIVIASANQNFNNTATVNVSVTSNGSQANIAFTANANALIASGNTSNIVGVVEANGQIQIDTRLSVTGGGGTPGGANLDIQYNLNGSFAGDAGLIWNVANTTMMITGREIITAQAGQIGLDVIAANGTYAVDINGSTNVGNSLGVIINAGTNVSDIAFRIRSANTDRTFLTVDGNSIVTIGGPATTAGVVGNTTLNTSALGYSLGRSVLVMQGAAGANDGYIAWQNAANYIGGYLYSSNQEMRMYGNVIINFEVGNIQSLTKVLAIDSTANATFTSNVILGSNNWIEISGTSATQILLNSPGSDWGCIANPINQVWCLGASPVESNAQPTVNVLSWSAANQVGIGTLAAQTKFDVIGTVRANNYQDHYANTGTPATFSNSFIVTENANWYANGTYQSLGNGSNWNNKAYGPAMSAGMIRGQTVSTSSEWMLGLTTTPPAANQSEYAGIDFALYFNAGTFFVYEDGSSPGSFGAYTAANGGAVMYDGNNVTYFANTYTSGWVPIRTVNKPGLTMYPVIVAVQTGAITTNAFFQTAQTIDVSLGTYQDITLANNIYITLQNCATTGNTSTITLLLRQTTQTNCGIAFSNTIKWSDNKLPGLSAGPNTADIITLQTYNGGTFWLGSQVMGNIASMNVY